MSEYCVQKPRECDDDDDDDTIARARAPAECDFIEFISIFIWLTNYYNNFALKKLFN